MSKIIWLHGEIDGLCRQVGMQFTWFAIQSQSAIIIDTVGYIRRLLNFCQPDATTYGVHPASRQIKHVAWFHRMGCQHLGDGTIGHTLAVFLGGDTATKSH